MKAIEPYRGPVIEVTVPEGGALCDAKGCDYTAKADMVWNDQRAQLLRLLQVCAQHLFLLRGQGPALFFPLDGAPPLEVVAQRVNAEMQRRDAARQAQMYRPMQQTWTNFGTANGTFTGGSFTFTFT